jgi:exodeoxyribonuclease VII small subunit
MKMDKGKNYTEAILELEAIVAEIEEGSVTVDVLSEKVRRAAELIRICKARLTSTEEEVRKVLDELNPPPNS